MADIKITDSLSLVVQLKIADDSALAKAGITQLISATSSFVSQLSGPVDQAPFQSAGFGAKVTAPSQLIDNAATLAINATASGQLTIKTSKDKCLFDDDGLSPTIPITPADCWIGLEMDTNITSKISGTANGFGVSLGASSSASFATYLAEHSSGNGFPSLNDALSAVITQFSVLTSAKGIRDQGPGTVEVSHVTGTVTVAGTYQLPLSVDALASAQLPFNYNLKINPGVTVKVGGQIAITGDFVFRSYKVSPTEVRLGCYKTKGSTLTASFIAGAGIQVGSGSDDLFSQLFGVLFPSIDVAKAGITGDQAAALNSVVKDSIDHSLSVSINAECSASQSDEAAIFVTLDLGAGDVAGTDAALADALGGDWTKLVELPNARVARNVLKVTEQQQFKIKINLLGIYNAESIDKFVRDCTVIHDGGGVVTITDKITASHIALASTPLQADPDKLRKALSEAFLATAAYSAGGTGIQDVKTQITVTQSYFRYEADMDRQTLRDEFLLGPRLGLFAQGAWDGLLDSNRSFSHAMIDVSAKYDQTGVLSLFFADPKARTGPSLVDLKEMGRNTRAALIDPNEPTSAARLLVLTNPTIWAALDDIGAVTQFSTVPYLSHCNPNEIGDIGADWIDITWWAEAMSNVSPALAKLIAAAEGSTAHDPTQDPDFLDARDKLAGVLGEVAKNTKDTFVGGWGIAVMYAVSGGAAALDMTVSAQQLPSTHYAKAATV
jgi:hypothetical protein